MTPKIALRKIVPMINSASGSDADALNLAVVALGMWSTLRDALREQSVSRKTASPFMMPGDTVWEVTQGKLIRRKVKRVVYREGTWAAEASDKNTSIIFFSIAKPGKEGVYRDPIQAVTAAIDQLCKEGVVSE